MLGKPWETPLHPVNMAGDFWTMMNPEWQAQLLDHNKILETMRWSLASGYDFTNIIRQNCELFDSMAKANLAAVEMYGEFLSEFTGMMFRSTVGAGEEPQS